MKIIKMLLFIVLLAIPLYSSDKSISKYFGEGVEFVNSDKSSIVTFNDDTITIKYADKTYSFVMEDLWSTGYFWLRLLDKDSKKPVTTARIYLVHPKWFRLEFYCKESEDLLTKNPEPFGYKRNPTFVSYYSK